MSGLSFLIPVALFLGLLGLGAFFWALKRGQFEDLDGAALRILDDEAGQPVDDAAMRSQSHGADAERRGAAGSAENQRD